MIDGIVLVHGGGHGKWCWEEVQRRIDLPTLAVDLPGRGDRPYDGTLVTLGSCVNAVLEDVERAGWKRFVLVGHSMGGLTITELAYRFPEKVAHLVYLDAVAFPPGTNQQTFSQSVLGYVPDIEDLTACHPNFDKEFTRDAMMRDLDDDVFETAYAKINPEPYGLWVASVSGFATDVPATYFFCLHMPDNTRPPRQYTVELLSNTLHRLEVIELDADHDVMLSQPDLVSKHLAAITSSA